MSPYLMRLIYIGAGRDVVKFHRTALTGGTSLLMADPDYDLGLQNMEKVKKEMGVLKQRVRGEVSIDARGLRFTPLPETRDEANAIDRILRSGFKQKVLNYQGSRAMEEMLYTSAAPRVIHLATHGFFFKALPNPEQGKRGLELKVNSGEIRALNIENPMLRSGIVLSGVNSALKEGRDDGLVSAEKILGLRLRGTELVVLSACETGVGDVQTGEGVFGLKRAFILSGARSLLMSLWNVPSAETVTLMKGFYTQLLRGKTKAEALRQAKLHIMKTEPNPTYWGAFVLTGSP
jgi:CHAT domain-containing protein